MHHRSSASLGPSSRPMPPPAVGTQDDVGALAGVRLAPFFEIAPFGWRRLRDNGLAQQNWTHQRPAAFS